MQPWPARASSQRLNGMLDLVRNEFQTVSQNGSFWKAQRDEYQAKVQQQIEELNVIRRSLHDLQNRHQKLRQDYEGEIARLRRELHAPEAGGGGAISPPDLSQPGDEQPPFRPPFPASPASPPLNGVGPGASSSSYPGAGAAALPPSVGAGGSGREPGRNSPSSSTASPVPPALFDLDPDNVSPELKKEGSDWSAVWSSLSKRQLDISLTHTLNHQSVVCCVKFSNDGKYVATGCNRTAQIYDVKSGGKVCVLLDEQATRCGDLYIRTICFSPDSKYLATGGEDSLIRIWNIEQKRIHHLLQGHTQEIYSLDFSHDGQFLVSGSADKSVRIWDTDMGQCVLEILIEDFIHDKHGPVDAGITSVALSPHGELVAAGSLDGMVRVWNVSTRQQVERLKGHKDSVYSVAFSPEGKSLVSGSLDGALRVWDLSTTERALQELPHGSKDSAEKNLGTCQATLNGHKDYVLSVAISPDGRWVVSGSKDRSIQFWDMARGEAQCILRGHKNSVISIDLARSGTYLASGSGDCVARIWKYESAQ